ncbi:MAG: GIY-YIG nuclease family protein [Desulfurococcus sp.]|nr:GIY-YIG nuclease family protein [Desulfurococcus sp.]
MKYSLIDLNSYLKSCYILVSRIQSPIRIAFKKGYLELAPGAYFYVGSARGSCDVIHRVLRHLSPSKKLKWHIDLLTVNSSVEAIGFFMVKYTGGDCESTLSFILSEKFNGIEGFGCTDKPGDRSHLYACTGILDECLHVLYEILEESGFEPIWIQRADA